MGIEDAALTRLRRYRKEADRSLGLIGEAEAAARRFSEKLFSGLQYTAALAREARFEVETEGGGGVLVIKVRANPGASGAEARLTLGLLRGAAAESDEDLMHEELSRYDLDPSSYSGRILGWSEAVGENSCQTFAVYRDGVWKTKGVFVERARGKVDDPEDVIHGFCLRIMGRLIDLAALTGGAGRRWSEEKTYTLPELLGGENFPTELRLPR